MDSKLVLSKDLQDKGIKTGKFYIENDSLGKNNKLVIYLVTEKDFKGALTFKIIDKKGLETGRKILTIDGKAGGAGYHDVVFDERTKIEVKSTIEIQ